jgi:NDP-sugar pyrophosphorylase family protein
VVVGGDGLVRAIAPPSAAPAVAGEYLFTGAMIVSRASLDALPVRVGGVWENLWRPALEAGGLAAVAVGGGWREVGTPSAYLECVLELLEGQSSIDASAEVASGAVIEEALIGRGATIDASAAVRRSVVAEEARVGRGARVEDSVMLGAVRIGCGETVIGEFRARAATGLERGPDGAASDRER